MATGSKPSNHHKAPRIRGSIMADNHKIKAFKFDEQEMILEVLDQTQLPHSIVYVSVPDCQMGYYVIKNMLVRGAPCIAAVGCLSLVAELNQPKILYNTEHHTLDELEVFLRKRASDLISSRPTAVNLKNALNKLLLFVSERRQYFKTTKGLIDAVTNLCLEAIKAGESVNMMLGDYGAEEIMKNCDKHEGIVVLTHCNTGSLATVGFGTALGVIRSLRNKGQLKQAYCTETRPYNQGSRLTAWEMVMEKMPGTLIADSMVAYLMSKRKINAVVVGADCVAANGDTANKVGTLQISIVAKHYNVPFYVAAPTQSIDMSIQDQSNIKIELRPSSELRKIDDIVLAPSEIDVWNPCFDVTPASLITGIITEYGVCKPHELREFIESISDKLSYDSHNLF